MKALINESVAKIFEEKTGISTIPLKPYKRLDFPVASHADMLFCVLDDIIFCYRDYVCENNLLNELNSSGKNIVFVSKKCEKEYPQDIGLNVLVMGKSLFCNVKYTAEEILEYAKERNYSITNVKQGYSSCSTLVLNDNNALTSDPSIYNAIIKAGKNAFLVDNSTIKLDGYGCGFIGGASGVFGQNVYVFGDISSLSNGKQAREIICNLGYNIIPILLGEVYDFGGIKFI